MKKLTRFNFGLFLIIYFVSLFLSKNTMFALKMKGGLLSDNTFLKFIYTNKVYFEGALYETKLYFLFLIPTIFSIILLVKSFKNKESGFLKFFSILTLLLNMLILVLMKTPAS